MTNFILTGARYSGVDELAHLMVNRGVFRTYIVTDRAKRPNEVDGLEYNPKAWKGSGIYPEFQFTDSRYSETNFEETLMLLSYVYHEDRYGIPADAFLTDSVDTVTVLPPDVVLRLRENPDIYQVPDMVVVWVHPVLTDRFDNARQLRSLSFDDMAIHLLQDELDFKAFAEANLGDLGGPFGFAYDAEWTGAQSLLDFWIVIRDAFSKHGYISKVTKAEFEKAAANAVDVSDPVDLTDLPAITKPAYLKSVIADIKKES
jgi:hypothetical protein